MENKILEKSKEMIESLENSNITAEYKAAFLYVFKDFINRKQRENAQIKENLEFYHQNGK